MKVFRDMETTVHLFSTTLSTLVHSVNPKIVPLKKIGQDCFYTFEQVFVRGLTLLLAADVLGALAVLADGGISVFH